MKKNRNNIQKIILFLSCLFIWGIFNSCQMFTDSWNTPVKGYFKEYTENAAIVNYEFEKEYPVDSEGFVSIPAYSNINVNFILRNPQKYVVNTSVEFNNKETSKDYGLGEFPTISQNAEDLNLLNMTLTSVFLKNHEWGGDISSRIFMVEPKSGRGFYPYDFKLRCNTPPDMFGAIVCNLPVGNETKYVLCFNLPKTEYLKTGATHSDIEKIIIDGTEFPISIDDNGIINTNLTSLVTQKPEGMGSGVAGDFIPTGTALYYITDDVLKTEDTVYNLGVQDNKGLNLFYKVSAKAVALEKVSLFDIDGKEITADSKLVQDDGSSYSSVQIIPPATVSYEKNGQTVIESTEDAYIVYEIYSIDDSGNETLIEKSRNKGKTVVKLSPGKNKIKAYAQKDYFADSPENSTDAVVLSTLVYVDETFDGYSTGSEDKPFRTLQEAYNSLSDWTYPENTIRILSDITNSEDKVLFSLNAENSFVTFIGKKADGLQTEFISSAEKPIISVNAGKLSLQNIKIQGSETLSLDYTVFVKSGAELVLNNCTIKGKSSNKNVYIENGAGFTVSGLVEIYEINKTNVYLCDGAKISIAENTTLDSNSKIGVTLEKNPDVNNEFIQITNGFKNALTDKIIISDEDFAEIINKNEVCFAISSGNVQIPQYTLKLSADKNIVTSADSITIKAEVYKNDVKIQNPTLTNWKIKIYNHGIYTGKEISTNILQLSDLNLLKDDYVLFVSVDFNGTKYDSSFNFTLTE